MFTTLNLEPPVWKVVENRTQTGYFRDITDHKYSTVNRV